MRRVFSILLSMLLLSAVLPGTAGAIAPTDQAVVVVGADLMEDQVEQIYTMFGLTRGTVPELTVTNAEDEAKLNQPIIVQVSDIEDASRIREGRTVETSF